MATTAPVPSVRTVVPWLDPVVDQLGHEPRSAYVERFWLPILGPTATWLLRRLAARFDDEPHGFELDLVGTSLELGLGAGVGPHAPFTRTLQRCARFGIVSPPTEPRIRVRRHLPPLTRGQVTRLPEQLQAAHDRLATGPATRPAAPRSVPADQVLEAGRGMALALLRAGQPRHVAERALHERGVHPAVAFAAIEWAAAQTDRSPGRDERPLPPAA